MMPDLDASQILTYGLSAIAAVVLGGLLILIVLPSVIDMFRRPRKSTAFMDEAAEEILNRDWAFEKARRMLPSTISEQDMKAQEHHGDGPLGTRFKAAFRRFSERIDDIADDIRTEDAIREVSRKIEREASGMSGYVDMLAALDADEVAPLLAMAVHLGNVMMDEDVDLFDPAAAQAMRPGLMLKLADDLERLRTAGDLGRLNGPAIWLYSLVAVHDPRRRMAGRRLWRELHRGAAHVESARESVELLVGAPARLEGANRFPKGLTPDPV